MVVDALEEVFTQGKDHPAEVARFAAVLQTLRGLAIAGRRFRHDVLLKGSKASRTALPLTRIALS